MTPVFAKQKKLKLEVVFTPNLSQTKQNKARGLKQKRRRALNCQSNFNLIIGTKIERQKDVT